MRAKRIRSLVSLLALTSVFTIGGVAAGNAEDLCVKVWITIQHDNMGPGGVCYPTEWDADDGAAPGAGDPASVRVDTFIQVPLPV